MPLNLPVKEAPVIDPKATVSVALVVETAGEYARRHDLCTVVNDALHDMGIDADVCDDDDDEVTAYATVTITCIVRRDIEIGNVRDKTEAEVNEHLKGLLYSMNTKPDFYYGAVESTDWEVTDVNLTPPPMMFDGVPIPAGYQGRYADGGSVVHLVQNNRTLAVCGVIAESTYQMRNGVTVMCARCWRAA